MNVKQPLYIVFLSRNKDIDTGDIATGESEKEGEDPSE